MAANTAAANAFPDRGGGGYLGRSLPQVFRSGSVIVSPVDFDCLQRPDAGRWRVFLCALGIRHMLAA
jgi:hypothetical protein